MKKISKQLFVVILATILLPTLSYATVTTLWRATNTTYVSSEHGDEYFADTYYGVASVRGADRTVNYDNRNIWYKWTEIIYDVQGDRSSARAYAGNKYNTNQVVEKITVKDKWNNGPKTRALYDYSSSIADGNTPMYLISDENLIDNDYEIRGGGELKDGEIIREGKVLEQGIDLLQR